MKNVRTALIPRHAGYRELKTFQIAQLAFDVTVRFCDLYVDRKSRTRDQMTQAARSGVQNIAEGSVASGTSKKMELKLTNVARASLEELRLDYEDFLRQRELPQFQPDHPALRRFKALRCASMVQFKGWVADEMRRTRSITDPHGPIRRKCGSVTVRASLCQSVLVANAVLSLLNLVVFLLKRQVEAQATAFEVEGGFTERLYKVRKARPFCS